jgi:hypothetical protein
MVPRMTLMLVAGHAPALAHWVDAHPALADALAQGGVGDALKRAGKAILWFLFGIFVVGAIVGLLIGFFIGRTVGRNNPAPTGSAVDSG